MIFHMQPVPYKRRVFVKLAIYFHPLPFHDSIAFLIIRKEAIIIARISQFRLRIQSADSIPLQFNYPQPLCAPQFVQAFHSLPLLRIYPSIMLGQSEPHHQKLSLRLLLLRQPFYPPEQKTCDAMQSCHFIHAIPFLNTRHTREFVPLNKRHLEQFQQKSPLLHLKLPFHTFTPAFAFRNSGSICFLKLPQDPQKKAAKSPFIQS